jgi:hypothetical protein
MGSPLCRLLTVTLPLDADASPAEALIGVAGPRLIGGVDDGHL